MEQTLFPSEKPVAQWSIISLTTHRLREQRDGKGVHFVRSLVVSKIDWAEMTRVHTPAFLLLAAISIIGGLVAGYSGGKDGGTFAVVGLLLGLGFFFAYWRSRILALSFGAGNGRIKVFVPGKNNDLKEARAFLDAVESQVYAASTRASVDFAEPSRGIAQVARVS